VCDWLVAEPCASACACSVFGAAPCAAAGETLDPGGSSDVAASRGCGGGGAHGASSDDSALRGSGRGGLTAAGCSGGVGARLGSSGEPGLPGPDGEREWPAAP
jgi:hypothetical protein